MMETIRIYHSTWRMLLLAIVSLAMAVGGYLMAIHSPKGFHFVVGWIGVVFFGVCGIYMLYGMLKERLTAYDAYAIADSGIFLEECPAYARSRTNHNCLFFIFRAHLFSEITTIT